jgi:hypothetical protein
MPPLPTTQGRLRQTSFTPWNPSIRVLTGRIVRASSAIASQMSVALRATA